MGTTWRCVPEHQEAAALRCVDGLHGLQPRRQRGGRADRYGDDDTFKVWDAGVLEVATGGGIVIYGPTGWLRIDVAPHQSDRLTFFGGVLQ